MIIDLSPSETDTKYCESETGTLPLHDITTGTLPLKGSSSKKRSTIKRRNSFNSVMKFLTKKNALFTITEQEMQSLEDSFSSSFTAGTQPTKPEARKPRKGGKKKKKKSILHKSLESALKLMDSRGDESEYDHPSSNSLATASTASLSDEESRISPKQRKPQAKNMFSKDKRRRAKGERREKRDAYANIAKNVFSKDEKRRAKENICAAVKQESRHIRSKDETRKTKKEICDAVKRESKHIRFKDEKNKAKKELCAAVKRAANYVWSECEVFDAIEEEPEADYVLPEEPLLPGEQRWAADIYMYGRREQRDEAPICPVRRE